MTNTEIKIQKGTILQSRKNKVQYTVTQVRVNSAGEHLSYLAVDDKFWAIVIYPSELHRWEVMDFRGSNSTNL